MEDDRRLTIGEFAARTGLTTRALRLYADAGVLNPVEVDATTGYRSYARTQLERAERVRLLRTAGVPVVDVAVILDSAPHEAMSRLDAHLAALDASHASASAATRLVRARLTTSQPGALLSTTIVERAVLVAAVDAASRCCASDPDRIDAPLAGIRCRFDAKGIHLVSSDRYSGAFVDVACTWAPAVAAARLVPAGFLAGAADSWPTSVEIGLHEDGLTVDGEVVPTLPETFPDIDRYAPYLDRLGTGCVVSTSELLAALPPSEGPEDDELAVILELRLDAQELVVTPRGRDVAVEDRRLPTAIPAVGDHPMETAWVSPSRLRSILAAVGGSVVLSLARLEPVAIADVASPDLRFLLMPMASVTEAELPPGMRA